MSSRIRSSKVRHVFCDEPKPEFTYSGFTLDTTLGDHPFISCSTKYVSRACSRLDFVFLVVRIIITMICVCRYFACSLRGGGGPVLVWNFGRYGKVDQGGKKPPVLNGHKDAGPFTLLLIPVSFVMQETSRIRVSSNQFSTRPSTRFTRVYSPPARWMHRYASGAFLKADCRRISR